MVPCEEESLEGHPAARRGHRRRRHRAQLRLPARHVASAAWARRSARCPNTSRWSRAGASSTRRMPVIVKLTPNITDILPPGARGEARRRRRGVAHQHHQLHRWASTSTLMAPQPHVDGKGTHGGYCGPAVKPIALHMVGRDRARPRDARPADLRHRRHRDLARRGRVHGARRGQRAGLHRGHALRLQDRRGHDRRACRLDGREGLSRASTSSSAAPCRNVIDWEQLNLDYVVKARIDQDLCIKCGRCHIACEDTSHQAITSMRRTASATSR